MKEDRCQVPEPEPEIEEEEDTPVSPLSLDELD